MELTKNELQILTVMWHSNTPLTSAEIRESSTDRKWSDNSLYAIINNLMEKGVIKKHGFTEDGGSPARTYVPVLTRDNYYDTVFAEYQTEEFPAILAALAKRARLDDEVKRELRKAIEELHLEV